MRKATSRKRNVTTTSSIMWTHARDEITKQMMDDLKNDRRKDETGHERPYLNPIYLMAHSGARGGTEQIRQLAGIAWFDGQA